MIEVKIFTKEECHLCEVAKKIIKKLQLNIPFNLVEVDITQDPCLYEKYKEKIPIISINGRETFFYKVNPKEFKEELKRTIVINR